MGHAPGSTLRALVRLGRTPDACWEWLGKIDENGYAIKQFDGKPITARRWMWQQLFGPVPLGLIVSSTCGSKTCTNPFHLRLCTQADACQSGIGTILTHGDVVEIRKNKGHGGDQMAKILAERLGISAATVRDIWRRSSWNKPKPFAARNTKFLAPNFSQQSTGV
jgi:hypothetical protein